MLHTCKMCGGILASAGDTRITTCEYCGTRQTIPCPDSERIAGLYEKADAYRRNLEFDKALVLYEEILNEDSTDAECYWLALLCEFGIEYVEENAGKRLPTINRMQAETVFDNANYKAALQYATEEQAEIYKTEAEEISSIQKGILEISEKEEPFDIFICYKESDDQGRRTLDSVLAMDLYEFLTKEGYKVFFSRVTLDDKIGVAYEPYIYAALQSSKIMIAVGTKAEHYNAVWVRNEWSRYLALIKSGAKKVLIPAYKDMDPYELPEEFRALQAINMGELGYQQDLVRGIRKMIEPDKPRLEESIEIEPMKKRMIMFLEDKKWDEAEKAADRILGKNPGYIKAELAKLLAAMHIAEKEDLVAWQIEPSDKSVLEILDAGNEEEALELKQLLESRLPWQVEKSYQECIEKYETARYSAELIPYIEVLKMFKNYRDSEVLYRKVNERVGELRKKEQAEYDDLKQLSTSHIYSDLVLALRLLKKSDSPLVSQKDITDCKKRIKGYKAMQITRNVMWILLGASIVATVLFFVFLMTNP